ncbi:unnamed protein product [Cylicostephanus goldi]|uniref:Uncharacterized protein n=1 Tax=Cylicostephanus goldi TaxID=71465 RepID=A0A3P7QHR4_CYLGO|nr:unnamed protein product [Cylicostephanus goldi]
MLLAIALRDICLQIRPFQNPEETWVSRLTHLFKLQNYSSRGNEPPTVKTELHTHLDNVLLAYDHAWTKPDSSVQLRLVIGEADINSSIAQDMDVAKCNYTCDAVETEGRAPLLDFRGLNGTIEEHFAHPSLNSPWTGRTRAHPQDDDEFCVLDTDTGAINSASKPHIKYIGTQAYPDITVDIDYQHFPFPRDCDEFAALLAKSSNPTVR